MVEIEPQLLAATLDGEREITARFSRRVPVAECSIEMFTVVSDDGHSLTVESVAPIRPRHGLAASYTLITAEPIDFTYQTFELVTDKLGRRPIRVWRVLRDPDRFYDRDARLGAWISADRTNFGVFGPTASAVTVIIADGPEGPAGVVEHSMQRNDKGVWSAEVPGNLIGKFYAYKLQGPGFDSADEITDIYATCTQGRSARSLIVDLPATDPAGFRDYIYRGPTSPVDAIIYEMHVRDFTIADNSGVADKGRYLGLTEAGTHLSGDCSVSTGLDHLVEMGVTHVQLMPVQDFDNNEGPGDDYNWGYMPLYFNSPYGWYASSVVGPSRICELKQAIKAFHDRGIGVVMDVVYNHTANDAAFERLVPGYYYRTRPTGRFCNGSGCGNEFMSENPMARKYILDSLRFWVEEYLVDGFRFDIMALIDLETMKLIKAELERIRPGILLYGEPWPAGPTPLKPITDQSRIRGTGIGAFNDHFRDAIKGDRDDGPPGFIQVGDRRDEVAEGLLGAINDWSLHPADSINYFEVHDNLTAFDKLLQSVPDASHKTHERMLRFASLILLTSQGSILLHSGQEFCRSKKGSCNSYNLPDEINQIDWSLKKAHADLCAYVKGLIALRKAHPVFRLRTKEQVEQRIELLPPPNKRAIVYRLDGRDLQNESAETILVLLNGQAKSARFSLPEGIWSIFVDAEVSGTDELATVSTQVRIGPHCGMVLCK